MPAMGVKQQRSGQKKLKLLQQQRGPKGQRTLLSRCNGHRKQEGGGEPGILKKLRAGS